ncbi:MAG: sugar phosphate nucleotidyltransferase [Chloroflexota bacterium]
MYAVIMAGGGGTRLWPLSRPERPKPFLPLLGERSLFEMTVDRLLGGPELGLAPTDVTVVADGRHAELARSQRSDLHVLVEPMGRNTAAAIALATLAIDRDDNEVMLVLPADAWIAPGDEGLFRSVLARAARDLTDRPFGIEDPLVTLGVQASRPAIEYGYLVPDLARGEDLGGLRAYPLKAFEEKPRPERARELVDRAGVAWNAGIFLWRRRAIRAALERHTGFVQSLGPMIGSPATLAQAYESIQRPMSIDHAVMEGAAAAGRVVMGSMNVRWSDLGSWTALLAALEIDAEGLVVRSGETVDVSEQDLIVRRSVGRVSAVAPLGRGSMTATQTIAVLRGARPRAAIVDALLARCSEPEG